MSYCVCLNNLVVTPKLAVRYHTEFAKISSNPPPCPQLGPVGLGEEGLKMKVPRDLSKIKNKSLGASGLIPLVVKDFEVLDHTVNCESRD